jgi:hypothetical protein
MTASIMTTSTTTRRPAPRVLNLDGGELLRDTLPRRLQALDDDELRARLVVGYIEPLMIPTQ